MSIVLSLVAVSAVQIAQGGLRAGVPRTPRGVARTPLFETAPGSLPANPTLYGGGVAAGDVTGDGYPDLVIATGSGAVLYRNLGGSTFADETARRLPSGLAAAHDALLVDVDGDGVLDLTLLASDPSEPDVLLRGDGAGAFDAPIPLPPTSSAAVGVATTSAAAWIDADGDGDLDLVRAVGASGHTQASAPASLHLADGAGGYALSAAFAAAPWNDGSIATTGLCVLDANLDGRADLFFTRAVPTNAGAQNVLLVGTPAGTFADATSASLPALSDNSHGALAADVDGDGDLDLVVGNSLIAIPGALSGDVLVNQGGAQSGRLGTFLDAPDALDENVPFAEAIRLGILGADVDLDGRTDVLLRIHDLPPVASQPLHLGRADGTFRRATFATGSFVCAGGTFVDFDLDGDPDLVLTAAGSAAGGNALGRAFLFRNLTR